MGRLLAHQGGGRAERMTRDIPDRGQHGGACAFFEDQLVEGIQMMLLVRFHLFQLGRDAGLVRQGGKHGALALIDGDGPVFAGMVDTDHFLDPAGIAPLAGQGRTGAGVAGGFGQAHLRNPWTPTQMEMIAITAEISPL